MNSLSSILPNRRRTEPPVDIGLAAERTAMSWQRTGLGLAGFSALLVHLADRHLLAASPGLVGLVLALVLLVVGERRYGWTVRRVEEGRAPLAHRLVTLLTVGVVLLSASTLVLVVVVET